MEKKALTASELWFVNNMCYMKKHDRPGYNAALCILACFHEEKGINQESLVETLQGLTRGDFKRAIKCIRKAGTETVVPGVVEYIRRRWLGKEDVQKHIKENP